MRPPLILSNTVSLNGSLTVYDVDYGLHYRPSLRKKIGLTLKSCRAPGDGYVHLVTI